MADLVPLNPDERAVTTKFISKIDVDLEIKREIEVKIKPEPQECVTCSSRGRDGHEICSTSTASGALLHDFLYKLTRVDLSAADNCPRYMCKNCFELINVLEAAEQEYIKLKQTFEEIISRNPLFEQTPQPIELGAVKTEVFEEVFNSRVRDNGGDSEDEPLAITKKKRHRRSEKIKKKTIPKSAPKRKPRNTDGNNSAGYSPAPVFNKI